MRHAERRSGERCGVDGVGTPGVMRETDGPVTQTRVAM